MNIPKALYKAQQAKKKMSKIKVAGATGAVSVLVNGLSEVEEVEIDSQILADALGIDNADIVKRAAESLAKDIKGALNDSKKNLEKEMMNSADMDDLKGMLGL